MSLRIHILSDVHNEFTPFVPSIRDVDVVILAGDIGLGTKGIEWAKETFPCPVLYVPGNHEYYGGHLSNTLQKMRAAATDHVRVMDCDEALIGGVRFLCATGWTDYSATGNIPLAEWDAQQTMRDFKKIRATPGYRKVRPADFAELSRFAKRWLRDRLAESFSGPTVIVTHHAPSVLSLTGSPDSGSHLDAAYANRWEDLMGDDVELWVHGHTHHSVDYNIAGTRIISNPRGYPGESTGFDAGLIVELIVDGAADDLPCFNSSAELKQST